MTMTSGYDFGFLYGTADHSGGLIEAGTYAAVVEASEAGRTKAGDKGQWTIKTRITDPASPHLGKQLTGNISVSAENPKAIGIMFRHLAALGVPVPDPKNPAVVVNGQVPFWVNPQTGQPFPNDGTPERIAASVMVGKPVRIVVIVNEWEGGVNNKIRDWQPNPGGPVTWPQTGQQASPFGQQGYPPQQTYGAAPAPGYPPQQPWPATQQGYGQPGFQPQPGYPPAAPQQPAQTAPLPWQAAQQAPPQQPAQPPWAPQPQQGQPPVPGAPAYAQPGVPGAGGGAEFTPQGQSYQPGITPQPPAAPQPPWAQQPAGVPVQQPGQAYQPQMQAPAQPPAQPQFQPPGQPAYNGYPAQAQQQPQQGQGEAPPAPPWAQ